MQNSYVQLSSSRYIWQEAWSPYSSPAVCWISTVNHCMLGSLRHSRLKCRIKMRLPYFAKTLHFQNEDRDSDIDQSKSSLHVQALSNFPIEKLCGEVVLVRLDSTLLLKLSGSNNFSLERTISTIRHLYKAGAKVLLVTSWDSDCQSPDPVLHSTESLAEYVSSLLQIKVVPVNGAPGFMAFNQKELVWKDILLCENLSQFRGEVANCIDFSEKLASAAAIFVNDAFSLSHKVLASTVGVARFCHTSLAGFHFEEELVQLRKIIDTSTGPYMAIIGGRNLLRKAPALHLLASQCDGLFFVGKLAFQIMNGLRMPVPPCFLEQNAVGEALKLIQVARDRSIPIYYPTDLLCFNNSNPEKMEVFNSNEILSDVSLGWTPADIGPSSLENIASLIPLCKKILWVGPTTCDLSNKVSGGASQLGRMLERASRSSCDVILVGSAACKAVEGISDSSSQYKTFQNASVVWEFLKGRILPGIAALDKAYPYQIPWNSVFSDPTLPLVVDVGSGNGLFLFQMAKRWECSNFLGLENNEKLVRRCLNAVVIGEKRNRYFISTNATSTFHSIISSYPGDLVLVTIQCPNPDFKKEQYRWRMVQRRLVEAIVDILQTNGKVFLQSDVEAVLRSMKDQFMTYGTGRVVVDGEDEGERMENPFGVTSDWERHVLARGAPMYRTMLSKVR